MAHPVALAAFVAAVFPLVATPGASLTLLIRHVAAGGRLRAVPVVLGTATGIYVHAILAAVGLSAVLVRSDTAFTVVTYVGAGYLVALGLWTWHASGRTAAPSGSTDAVPDAVSLPRTYVEALLGNVLNPKAALVYLTLVPQFLDTDLAVAGQILTLATAHVTVMAVWLAACTGVLHRLVATPRAKRLFTRASALVLVGLGMLAVLRSVM
ncbi:LysE family translocator [Saccharomonospora iraqiensis]|uniref:LysE family translocator n=1 Tax=Saccharomonospora iraqiensis TaxID=52698 RepID=UPI00022E67BD|nr:LysE family translocator [Saccharomonospora iraqiensis]